MDDFINFTERYGFELQKALPEIKDMPYAPCADNYYHGCDLTEMAVSPDDFKECMERFSRTFTPGKVMADTDVAFLIPEDFMVNSGFNHRGHREHGEEI